jgi:hypothetical protein
MWPLIWRTAILAAVTTLVRLSVKSIYDNPTKVKIWSKPGTQKPGWAHKFIWGE